MDSAGGRTPRRWWGYQVPLAAAGVCWTVFSAPPNPPQSPALMHLNWSSPDGLAEGVVTILWICREATEPSFPSSRGISRWRWQLLPERVVTPNRAQQRTIANVIHGLENFGRNSANVLPEMEIAARSSVWWRSCDSGLKLGLTCLNVVGLTGFEPATT